MVSIIIPVYNVEKYLHKCMFSILYQSYSNLQIFLIDDGSTDSSSEICDNYAKKDKRITVIHKPNGGLSSARNAGLLAATGKYCYFLDSDDCIKPDLIESCVKMMLETQADLVSFSYEKVDLAGKVLETFQWENRICQMADMKQRFDFIAKSYYLYEIGFEVWNKFYDLEIIHKNQITFENNHEIFAEDLCFNTYYLLHSNKITVTDKIFYYYLIRQDSIIGLSGKAQIPKTVKLIDRIETYIKANFPECGTDERLAYVSAHLLHIEYAKFKTWELPKYIRQTQSSPVKSLYNSINRNIRRNKGRILAYYKGSCDRSGRPVDELLKREMNVMEYGEFAGFYYRMRKAAREILLTIKKNVKNS